MNLTNFHEFSRNMSLAESNCCDTSLITAKIVLTNYPQSNIFIVKKKLIRLITHNITVSPLTRFVKVPNFLINVDLVSKMEQPWNNKYKTILLLCLMYMYSLPAIEDV